MGVIFGMYCGNKIAGKNLRVTGERVKLVFRSDGEIEQGGYYLVFTLVSLPTLLPVMTSPHCKWDHKESD